MNRQTSTRAIFLAGMVFASGAFAASAEVKKCITESGHVTLTDEVCPGGSHTVKIISGPGSAQADTVTSTAPVSTERYGAARIPVRYATLMKSATLKTVSNH